MFEPSSDHPSPSELQAFSLGQADGPDSDRIYGHLCQCSACCLLLDGLAAGDNLVNRLRVAAAQPAEEEGEPALIRKMLELEHGRSGEGPVASRWAAGERQDTTAQEDAADVLRQVGEYQLLEEVGRGGMGVVYKARDRRLNRIVAIKMILTGEFASESQRLRFQLEAELAARVQHPNIVRVYEIGTCDGRPYLALEWVGGGTLADRLDQRPRTPHEAARLVETLARAIHTAHAAGVIHRDLKPANILFEPSETANPKRDTAGQATGVLTGPDLDRQTPKIADFGLARPVESAGGLTGTGMAAGTPEYMAPEQAEADHAAMGPPTDVYALGVILYELLTGRVPFQGKSPMDVLGAIIGEEPVSPRRLRPGLPRDLEAVVLKCLEKAPGRRYRSGAELAEDLGRFRQGQSVTAQPVSSVGRAVRWCRRHPSTAGLLAALGCVVLAALVLVSWKWLEADEQRGLATEKARLALNQAYRARIAAALSALQGHDVQEAARQLDAAPPSLREWEWKHLESRLDESAFAFPPRPGEQLSLVTTDQELGLLAVTSNHINIMNISSLLIRTIPIQSHGLDVRALHTRRGLRFKGSINGANCVLDGGGKVLLSIPFSCVIDLSRDLRHISAVPAPEVGDSTRAWVYDLATGNRLLLARGHSEHIYSLAFSPDGRQLATASEDATARSWEVATGRELGVFRGHSLKVLNLAYNADGTRLVTVSADGTVRQWDTATRREVRLPYDRHSGEVYVAAYSPDGRWIASSGSDGTVRVWNAETLKDSVVLHGHTQPVRELIFSGDGRWLGSASEDGSIRVWDMDPKHQLPALHGHGSYVYPVQFSPDGRWIASGSWDGTVRLWDARSGLESAVMRHPSRVLDLAISRDSEWLVTATGEDDRLRVWSLTTGRVWKEFQGPGKRMVSVAIRPDRARLAAVDFGGKAAVIDVATGQQVASMPGGDYRKVAYSPDGRWLALTGRAGILLWDQHGSGEPRTLESRAAAIAFGPASGELISAEQDGSIRVWDLVTGQGRGFARGHPGEVFAVAIHPRGTRVATAGRDGAIRLWDFHSGEEVARLLGHSNYIWSLAFSPDGGTLASGSGDGTVRLWDTEPMKLRHQAQRDAESIRPQAERLLERLLTEKRPDEAAAALRADPSLDETLRAAALGELLRRSTASPASLGPAPR